jgi:hypothetical protein
LGCVCWPSAMKRLIRREVAPLKPYVDEIGTRQRATRRGVQSEMKQAYKKHKRREKRAKKQELAALHKLDLDALMKCAFDYLDETKSGSVLFRTIAYGKFGSALRENLSTEAMESLTEEPGGQVSTYRDKNRTQWLRLPYVSIQFIVDSYHDKWGLPIYQVSKEMWDAFFGGVRDKEFDAPADFKSFVVQMLHDAGVSADDVASSASQQQMPRRGGPPMQRAMQVSRAFPSWNRPILAEIYLCHACSDHEISRMETPGQGGGMPSHPALANGGPPR